MTTRSNEIRGPRELCANKIPGQDPMKLEVLESFMTTLDPMKLEVLESFVTTRTNEIRGSRELCANKIQLN